MNDLLYYLSVGVLLLVLLYVIPLCCYLCAKMVTLGYLRAREKFQKEYKSQDQSHNHNGEQT